MDDFNWYWEILLRGDGPNYYLMFEFATSAAQLCEWMVPILSVDYDQPFGNAHWYSKDRSDWFYTLVEISDNKIWITYTWGVARSRDNILINTVLSTSPFEMTRWAVRAGGDGYSFHDYGQGTDVDSFLQYCLQGKNPL